MPGKSALRLSPQESFQTVINSRILDAPLTEWDAKLLQFPLDFVQKDTRIDDPSFIAPIYVSLPKQESVKEIYGKGQKNLLKSPRAMPQVKVKLLGANDLRGKSGSLSGLMVRSEGVERRISTEAI